MNGVERTVELMRADRIVWRVANGVVLNQSVDGGPDAGASELTGWAAMVWVALDEPATRDELMTRLETTVAEVDHAVEILLAAQDAHWAPIRHQDTLHDRASYRYFWHVLERAHRTGQPLPADVMERFFAA